MPVRTTCQSLHRRSKSRARAAWSILVFGACLTAADHSDILAAGETRPAPSIAAQPPGGSGAASDAPGNQATGQEVAAPSPPTDVKSDKPAEPAAAFAMDVFLDRLMMAESGGRLDARNPRSTALGPYQFIEATFLDVVRRHFPAEVAGKTDEEILALRTDRDFARKAAAAFSGDNMTALKYEKLSATPANLRLAFLLGPTAAIRVLQAPAESPLNTLLPPSVIAANPFMLGMTAAELAGRAARDVDPSAPRVAARSPRRLLVRVALAQEAAQQPLAPPRATLRPGSKTSVPSLAKPEIRKTPSIIVQCNRDLPSCRRWIALQTRIAIARAATAGAKRRIAQR